MIIIIMRNLKIIFQLFIYRFLLDIIYSFIIVPMGTYENYINEFTIGSWLISWLILLGFMPIYLKWHEDQTNASSLILLIVFFVTFVPFTTMVAYGYFTTHFIVSKILYWVFLFIFYKVCKRVKFLKIKKIDVLSNNIVIILIALIFLGSVIYISGRYTGFRISLDIFNVYSLRRSNMSINVILGYIFSASKSIIPVLLIYAFHRKKYSWAFIITIIQLLSFGINGMKSVLFITILTIFLFLLYKERYNKHITMGFVIFSMTSLFESIVLKTDFINLFITRRLFFLTNLLNEYYVDFFSSNTPDYFRQGFLRHFGISSPYTQIYSDIRYMIGDLYFNRAEMGANSGMISDAFSNFGFVGVIFMPFVIAISLRIFDNCVYGLEKKLYIASCLLVAYYLISSFYFTILLTHGFIALCIIFYFLPRNDPNYKRGNENL